MIKLLLPLLLTVATPVVATSQSPYDELNQEQLCSLVNLELELAIGYGIINKQDAERILSNCLR